MQSLVNSYHPETELSSSTALRLIDSLLNLNQTTDLQQQNGVVALNDKSLSENTSLLGLRYPKNGILAF